MLTSSMPSAMHNRFSIWPRFEAAAVCTSAVWPSRSIVPIIASAVSGLTKHDAPSAGVTPSGSASTCDTPTVRYCEYVAPPSTPTVRPINACASGDAPAATTTPPPSLPTGIDSPTRAAIADIITGAIGAVTTGRSGVPDDVAAAMSAPPNSRPRSDGLIGAASIRTTT